MAIFGRGERRVASGAERRVAMVGERVRREHGGESAAVLFLAIIEQKRGGVKAGPAEYGDLNADGAPRGKPG